MPLLLCQYSIVLGVLLIVLGVLHFSIGSYLIVLVVRKIIEILLLAINIEQTAPVITLH